MDIQILLKSALENKHKTKKYKMKCLPWYQRLYNKLYSWYWTIKLLPMIAKVIKDKKNG